MPVAIVGATGTGKTAAGIVLAEMLGTEIIGCDSRQVYRQLDIGSAKPTLAERSRVRHHLVDVVEPGDRYNAARYGAAARGLLLEFNASARTPLFVGGTGLYLRAALEGLCPAPPGLPGLRSWIAALAGTLPGGLHPLLARVDPAAGERIHPNDRFRLTRALEVYYLSGRTITEHQRRHHAGRTFGTARIFAIEMEGIELRRRISVRLDAMMAAGFLDEARRLLDAGIDPAMPALRAVGYPELFANLRGEIPLDTALAAIRRATWQYARRQTTWFRAQPGVTWIPAGAETPAAAIAEAILSSLGEPGRG